MTKVKSTPNKQENKLEKDVGEKFEEECRAQSQRVQGDSLETEVLIWIEGSTDVVDWR